MSDKPAYRPAIAADSRFIVDMIDIASDGVARVDWTQPAQEVGDQTPLDIGVQRYACEQGDYSYRNCWLAEVAGRRAGALLSFPMPARGATDAVSPPPFDASDVFAPATESAQWRAQPCSRLPGAPVNDYTFLRSNSVRCVISVPPFR